ncbi:MAG: hypothetical protein ABEK16_04665 [Candidatus Nanohalobium sp.]
MDLLSLVGGFVVGFVAGAGALIFYMRWKMMNQLNAMQQNMEGMFDMTEDMMDGAGMGDIDVDDVDMDEASFEEVEEEKEE